MANLIFNSFKGLAQAGTVSWTGGTMRCMLERSTSTYSPSASHVHPNDMTSFVEISVASYLRQTCASQAVNIDNSNNWASLTLAALAFGSLESGQTVKALVFFFRVGGSDSGSADQLICRIDTDAGGILPQPLGGGAFSVTINANGLITIS